MKLLNIFKKGTKTAVNVNVEKMDKIQLEKVIGGADTTTQTQQTSFGEKVNSGLHAAGSAVSQGV